MADLSEVLRSKLIPWAQPGAGKRFIVARPKMQAQKLPPRVQLSRRKLTGKRKVVKKNRAYQNIRNVVAEWPEEGLYELNKSVLVCVLDGNVNYPVGEYRVRCGPGHFIFIPPRTACPNGSRTYVDLEVCSSCSIITFLLHPNAVECWLSHGHPQGREKSNSYLILHDRVIVLLQALMDEVIEDKTNAIEVAENLLQAYLKVLHRELRERQDQAAIIKTAPYLQEFIARDATADFATQLEYYVQGNLREVLTLERAAREMYLSTAQFARKVRRTTGESFNQFVNRHRLATAKRLLHDSEWTVSIIARRVGFHSSSYFGAFFKQHQGETPGAYRARVRKSKPKSRKMSEKLHE